jgi:hypothetical protein
VITYVTVVIGLIICIRGSLLLKHAKEERGKVVLGSASAEGPIGLPVLFLGVCLLIYICSHFTVPKSEAGVGSASGGPTKSARSGDQNSQPLSSSRITQTSAGKDSPNIIGNRVDLGSEPSPQLRVEKAADIQVQRTLNSEVMQHSTGDKSPNIIGSDIHSVTE